MSEPVQPTADELRAEIASLTRRVDASTGPDGQPIHGYRERIEGLKARTQERTAQLVTLLQAQLGEDTQGG